MRRRTAMAPLGLGTSGLELRTLGIGQEAFGKHHALVCPYFRERDGGCTVWRHRNSVCSTWFCKHGRGATGAVVWQATEWLVRVLERSMAFHCVSELDLGDAAATWLLEQFSYARERANVSAAEMEATEAEDDARRAWGRWFGRETEFYERCATIARAADAREALRLGGSEAKLALRAVEAALAAHEDRGVPERLAAQPFEVVEMGAKTTRVQAYSPYDPIELPHALLAALPAFDGRRPTKKVLEAIRAEHDLVLDDDVVRDLVDHQLLAPA
jgi:hypothetical protein